MHWIGFKFSNLGAPMNKQTFEKVQEWFRHQAGPFFERQVEVLEKWMVHLWQSLRALDRKIIFAELKTLVLTINRQFFSQIPGVSALTGILVGAWVSSTFTTSRFWGAIANLGFTQGPRVVVSEGTFKILSITLPALSTAIVIYLVQKLLHTYRSKRLASDKHCVAGLSEEVRSEVEFRMALLDQARDLKLLSAGEYQSKQCELYQSFARSGLARWLDYLLHRFS